MEKVKVQPGQYFIGDPSYPLSGDDKWREILDSSDYFEKVKGTCQGFPVYGISTAHGDGGYFDQYEEFEYAVDSGTIGLVPLEICDTTELEYVLNVGFGSIISVEDDDFYIWKGDKGVIHIGDREIDTGFGYEDLYEMMDDVEKELQS